MHRRRPADRERPADNRSFAPSGANGTCTLSLQLFTPVSKGFVIPTPISFGVSPSSPLHPSHTVASFPSRLTLQIRTFHFFPWPGSDRVNKPPKPSWEPVVCIFPTCPFAKNHNSRTAVLHFVKKKILLPSSPIHFFFFCCAPNCSPDHSFSVDRLWFGGAASPTTGRY